MKRSADTRHGRLAASLRELFVLPLRVYRRFISPAIAPRCKYYPTCSTYALQAVRELGIVRGTAVSAWRLARCNPWSHGGVDELCDRTLFRPDRSGAAHDRARDKVAA